MTIKLSFEEVYPDFEDAVQFFSSKVLSADCIVTRNKDDFTMAEQGYVFTPEEFLNNFFAEREDNGK